MIIGARSILIHVVLLSGGSGSRLWPLSNSARSKQFLKVLRDEEGHPCSMSQRVVGQIRKTGIDISLTIATCANQADSIRSQIDGEYALVLEPERRDTAPAIMLACAHLDLEQGASEADTVVVMPIDTFASQDYYNSIDKLDVAVQGNEGDIVLLGVKPTSASEKFGYIMPGDSRGKANSVLEFREKPNAVDAHKFVSEGGLWNCGVFAFKLGFLRCLTKRYIESASYEELQARYSELPKNSFDYEVLEKAASIAVVPYEGLWKDLGTWNTLCEEMATWTQGRVATSNLSNVHIVNETGLPMVVAGLSDAVIVCTHDGLLACSKEASASIKNQVQAVGETRPMYERRRWGEYRVLDSNVFNDGCNVLTKELVVSKGAQLSYQRHAYRTEIWTVVRGGGRVVVDGCEKRVQMGDVINIQPLQLHAVQALEELHIIEVQLGNPLVEEDIERFGYYWK